MTITQILFLFYLANAIAIYTDIDEIKSIISDYRPIMPTQLLIFFLLVVSLHCYLYWYLKGLYKDLTSDKPEEDEP
jgi:hypothetical protein